MTNKSYFSIQFKNIPTKKSLPYDLYINSSAIKSREKFVRIFPQGEIISEKELNDFKEKYFQIYLSEDQRSLYVSSVSSLESADDVEKVDVFKDSAMNYLEGLFDTGKEFNTEVLVNCVQGCQESIEHMVGVIKNYSLDALQELIGKLGFHDFYTYDHSINVAMYSVAILKAIRPNCSEYDQVQAGLGGLLHDIGKIQVPTHILNKSGELSEEEFGMIKKHPITGKALLQLPEFKEIEGVDFKVLGRVVNEHHENVDGTGYPNKFKGDQIHLLARIVAIADFFDAVTTKRSYHDVLEVDKALKLMAGYRGKKIDPIIFDAFAKKFGSLPRKEDITKKLKDDFDSERPHGEFEFEDIKEDETLSFGKIKILK